VRCIQRHVAVREDDRAPAPRLAPARSSSLPWPEIEGVDIAGARGRLPDDPRLYLSLLRRMLAEHGDVAAPGASADAAVWKAFRSRAHKLRGTSGILGITAVADLAGRVEAACAHGRIEEAGELTLRLASELAALGRRAAGVLAAMPRASFDESEAADAELDHGALTRFAGLLRRHDLTAIEAMRTLAPHLRRLLDAPRFEVLADHIDHLRFEAAAQLVEALEVARG
jgi:hypothetical protein